MIDYIGQLLAQQLEREKGDGVWETGPVRVPLTASEEDQQEEKNPEVTSLPEIEGRDREDIPLTAGRLSAVAGGDIRRWTAGLGTLSQAGERRTAGSSETGRVLTETARELDQAVRISLAGLPAAEQHTQVVTLEPPGREQSGGEDGLRRLDRLVRRDARRFDGGFQLL